MSEFDYADAIEQGIKEIIQNRGRYSSSEIDSVGINIAPILNMYVLEQAMAKASVIGTTDHQMMSYESMFPELDKEISRIPELWKYFKIAEATYYLFLDNFAMSRLATLDESEMRRRMDAMSAFVSINPEKYCLEKRVLEDSGFIEIDLSDDSE